MREMKKTSIPWVSEIPAEWDEFPLHVLFEERKNKNIQGLEINLLSLSYGNIIRKSIESNEGLLPENFNGYNIIEEGDIVLRLTDLQNDHRSLRTGLVREHGMITSAYITLKSKRILNSEYCHYLLHAYDIMKVFYTMGEGVRQNLGYSELSYMHLPFPNIKEQEAIVSFLDTKCASIDEAISRQKEAIEKLESYKALSIKHAVTKGIRKGRCYKDSSITWIGSIPVDWDVIALKRIAKIQTGSTPSKAEGNTNFSDEGGIPWIKAENLNSIHPIHHTTEYLTKDGVESGRVFPPFSVYVCCIASVGKVGYSDIECSCNQQINALTFDSDKIYWKYGFYASMASCEEHIAKANTSVQTILNSTNEGYIKFPVPGTIEEQKEIVNYLDSLCSTCEEAIQRCNNMMDKLEEYKKSLIYNAVTGKIDCRNA